MANCYTGYIIHLILSYVNISYENLTIGLGGEGLFCARMVILERAPSLGKDLIGLWGWLVLCADGFLERTPSLDKDLIGLWEWLTLCADCCFGANSKLW